MPAVQAVPEEKAPAMDLLQSVKDAMTALASLIENATTRHYHKKVLLTGISLILQGYPLNHSTQLIMKIVFACLAAGLLVLSACEKDLLDPLIHLPVSPAYMDSVHAYLETHITVKKVIDYAFNTINVQKIEAYCQPDNQHSLKLLEKRYFQPANGPNTPAPGLLSYHWRPSTACGTCKA